MPGHAVFTCNETADGIASKFTAVYGRTRDRAHINAGGDTGQTEF